MLGYFLFRLNEDIDGIGHNSIQTTIHIQLLWGSCRLRGLGLLWCSIESISFMLSSGHFSFLFLSLHGKIILIPLHFACDEPLLLIHRNFNSFTPLVGTRFRRTDKLPPSFIITRKFNDEFFLFSLAVLQGVERVDYLWFWEVSDRAEG
jgi:hypothetical protein